MRFYSLPTPERLVEEAFTYARRRMPGKRLRTSTIQNRKAKVILKMELFIEYLDKQLHRMIISVPTFKDLHPFYQELLPETVNIVKVKQSVSQMVAVRKLLKKQLVQGRQRMHLTSPDALKQMDKASKSFFGRVANIMDSLGESVAIMNKANQLMKEVPDIRTDIPTIVLAGYPNTGKTTLLGRLTGSKARIASFPFTTKSLQLGYFQWKYHDIQVIDTPGLLDRPPEKRNPIEKKAMAALHHVANAILFVIDPTPTSGYPLAQQHALLMSLQKQFSLPFLLILNKT
ncbi:MAG: GTPase, partial [archaeon]|nr:GTPase [archaeon]